MARGPAPLAPGCGTRPRAAAAPSARVWPAPVLAPALAAKSAQVNGRSGPAAPGRPTAAGPLPGAPARRQLTRLPSPFPRAARGCPPLARLLKAPAGFLLLASVAESGPGLDSGRLPSGMPGFLKGQQEKRFPRGVEVPVLKPHVERPSSRPWPELRCLVSLLWRVGQLLARSPESRCCRIRGVGTEEGCCKSWTPESAGENRRMP